MLGRDVKVEPVIDSSGGEIELAWRGRCMR